MKPAPLSDTLIIHIRRWPDGRGVSLLDGHNLLIDELPACAHYSNADLYKHAITWLALRADSYDHNDPLDIDSHFSHPDLLPKDARP